MVKELPRPGACKQIRVGSDFCGLGTFMLAMRRTIARLQPGKYNVQHCFSSDKMRAAKMLAMHTDPPAVLYADVTKRVLSDVPATDVYSFTAPCVTFSSAGKSDGVQDKNGARLSGSALDCRCGHAQTQGCGGRERLIDHVCAPQAAPPHP